MQEPATPRPDPPPLPQGGEAEAPPPAGSLHDLLERLRARLPTDTIDDLWIFPARRVGGADSTVVVVASFEPGEERRRVLTARYGVTHDPKGRVSVEESVVEQGAAPRERIGRMVEGVLQRLGEDMDGPPRHVRVAGDPARWAELLSTLPLPDAP